VRKKRGSVSRRRESRVNRSREAAKVDLWLVTERPGAGERNKRMGFEKKRERHGPVRKLVFHEEKGAIMRRESSRKRPEIHREGTQRTAERKEMLCRKTWEKSRKGNTSFQLQDESGSKEGGGALGPRLLC